MAIFKCKMCGGALEIKVGESVAVCEYCNTKQTLPRLDDERKANLYDRANHFRRNNEFDKAMGIYEQILNEDKTDAESYWSLVLCRYGIEYVEDPASRKRVPTVNRAQFTSVFDDADYKSAIENADGYQKSVYEAEAKAINEIQKGILEISQKEEPFDVFICYKETDNNGRRTPDSVLANDLYHQLTQEGFKVFFSRITLEDKLGSAYEPYIFAALNSAKVMVVLGTRPEYFNAVWVKNEWSRYLSLVKNSNGKKMLIPAYKDMDPYDLPEEFSHLQAQDMSRLGFMQDLIRGIKKIIQVDESKTTVVKETVVTGGNANVEPLLKRIFIFLEDRDWSSADEYCEKVLDIDPENGEAYLGKLMVELRVSNRMALKDVANPFDDRNNYQKVMRYGDTALKKELSDCTEFIKTRNENTRLNNAYNGAKYTMNSAKSENEFKRAADQFKAIRQFKDSAALVDECMEKAEVARKDAILFDAKETMSGAALGDYMAVVPELEKIPGWKDADELKHQALKKIKEIEEQIEAEKAEAKRIEEEKKKERERIEKELLKAAEARAKKNKKLAMIITPIVAVVLVFVIVLTTVIIPNSKYNNAVALMEAGKYEEAITTFEELDDYKDSVDKIKECKYAFAVYLMEKKSYNEASTTFDDIVDYGDSKDKIKECKYNIALSFTNEKDYMKALALFSELGDFKDSKSQYSNIMKKFLVVRETISAGFDHTVGLKTNGKVISTRILGNYFGKQCDVSEWTDIVDVDAGSYHTVGLKSDGTVVAVGATTDGRCDVSDWSDIIAVSAGLDHTVGLKSDGTVVAVGYNGQGECNVSGWTDIVAISAGGVYTLGLKSDGTVVATGANTNGRCDVSDWTDIVAISAGGTHAVGLKADGTVVATEYVEGENDTYSGQCDVSGWSDIVAISAGYSHTVGIKSDGTVVAVGYDDDGSCDVKDWTDIVAVSTSSRHTVGLRSDGTVVSTKEIGGIAVYSGYGEVSDWKNIKLPENK